MCLRPCKRCGEPFLYCHSREPGRRYCAECAAPARKERERKARQAYRASPEGIEQHRDEEEKRRERRRVERVGDRRRPEQLGQLQVRTTAAAFVSAEEPSHAPSGVDGSRVLEWSLVVWPGLLEAARLLLGTEVACPFCGREGRVVRVFELLDWDRRRRAG